MTELGSISFGKSLLISFLGLSIVILVLALVALAIVIFSKFFQILGIGSEKKPESPVQHVKQAEEINEESYAVLMAAVCEEIKLSPDKFRIVQIKERVKA